MRVDRAVILAAGMGTRLLPLTKVCPKEMLPFPVRKNDTIVAKPFLQIVFEQCYDAGIRNFCFVVGKGKRVIEDYFTPDYDFVEFLEKKGKEEQARILTEFYKKVEDSNIMWINQSKPLGTAHAVLISEPFVDDEHFLLHAGDNTFLGAENHIEFLIKKSHEWAANLLVRKVSNPQKYGIIWGKEIEKGVIRVEGIEEKPKKPKSNLALTLVYILPPEIFTYLKKVKPSVRGEYELPDAIKMFMEDGGEVIAIEYDKGVFVDIGNTMDYLFNFADQVLGKC